MQSVGEKLRKTRLDKKASLDEVYKETKIYPRVLEALEQDRAHNFLSFIYLKGFLKTYARYLGLDSEKLIQEYIDSQKIEAPAAKFVLEKKHKAFSQLNPFLIFRVVSVLVLLIILVLYFRFVLKHIFQPAQEAKTQKVKVKVVPAPPVKAEDLVLEVRTKDACWMRVKVDNQAIFERTLPKGRREHWRAKKKIELRIGKPEALDVFLNGEPIDLKKKGVKRSLVITHEGIEGK